MPVFAEHRREDSKLWPSLQAAIVPSRYRLALIQLSDFRSGRCRLTHLPQKSLPQERQLRLAVDTAEAEGIGNNKPASTATPSRKGRNVQGQNL